MLGRSFWKLTRLSRYRCRSGWWNSVSSTAAGASASKANRSSQPPHQPGECAPQALDRLDRAGAIDRPALAEAVQDDLGPVGRLPGRIAVDRGEPGRVARSARPGSSWPARVTSEPGARHDLLTGRPGEGRIGRAEVAEEGLTRPRWARCSAARPSSSATSGAPRRRPPSPKSLRSRPRVSTSDVQPVAEQATPPAHPCRGSPRSRRRPSC